MDNNPPDQEPFGPIPEWGESGAPASTEHLQTNPAYQSTANDLLMGHPQSLPTYPSRVHVNDEGSPIRSGQWQAGMTSRGHNVGGQGQTNLYPFPRYTHQPQSGGVPSQSYSGAPLGGNMGGFGPSPYYGSNMQPSGQQMNQQFGQQIPQLLGQRQFMPGGSGLGQTQYPTVPPSVVSAPNNYGFGQQPQSNVPGAMPPLYSNTNFGQPSFGTAQAPPPMLPQSGGREPDQGQRILNLLTQRAHLGERGSSPLRSGAGPSTAVPANTANTPQAQTDATRPSSQNIPDLNTPSRQTPSRRAGRSGTPTAEDVRNNVKFNAPRSNALSWFPANHPIPQEVVKMKTGWHSGLNHFATYGIDNEPRLKYAMKLGRGRKPGGRKKLADGTQGDAYSHDHPAPDVILPARLGLMSFMQHWPNHAWGQGIRLLMAEGITPQQLWNNLPVAARHHSHKPRPWNYLQHVYSRETDKMAFEHTGVKRVPEPRGTKREKSLDDVEPQPQGSGKKLKHTPEKTTPPPSIVPTVDECPPMTPREIKDIPPRQRWMYLPPHMHTVEDYHHQLVHKKAIFLEMARRILSVTDEKFAKGDPESQVTHLVRVLDKAAKAHAEHLRISHNLPKADALWKDDDQADCMMRVLKKRGFAQDLAHDEPKEVYQARLHKEIMKSMLFWMENRIAEKEKQLKQLFPNENDKKDEDEGADIFAEEDEDVDADAEMDEAGEEEEQPAQTEEATGDDQTAE